MDQPIENNSIVDSAFSYTFEKSKMDESQKSRDRKMRKIGLSNRVTERVKRIIKDLEHHGPAGLIHISVLGNIIGKSIKIWNADNSLKSIIGKERTGLAINIEYHTNDLGGIGHWTLMKDKDPDNTEFDLNSCLFSVIGSQTGLNPLELRKWTMSRIKSNLRQLAKRLDEILGSKGTNNEILMIGGARYCGTSPAHAKLILDNSQNAICHYFGTFAHPRGHASHPSAVGMTDSAENYSRIVKKNNNAENQKSAFLSRADQDTVTHFSLITNDAVFAMERLNRGELSEVIKIQIPILVDLSRGDLPSKGKIFERGIGGVEQHIKCVILVLRHHMCQYYNQNADVLIQTCYPVL